MLSSALLAYPSIDPVIVQLGPLAIRWYSLAYILGVVLGWWYTEKLNAKTPPGQKPAFTAAAIEDSMIWAILGIVAGGRLGYVLFYKPQYLTEDFLAIFKIWEGGMSFHGGLIGVLIAFWLFCRKYHLRFLAVMDVIACVVPIGLLLGRLANFINGELYGRPTDVPWAMVFPYGGVTPRHPSQLYEAALEGIGLFLLLYYLAHFTRAREKIGLLSGVFLLGYSLSRIVLEQFREPDAHLGFLFDTSLTMGQLLSVPMLAFGAYLVWRAQQRHPHKT